MYMYIVDLIISLIYFHANDMNEAFSVLQSKQSLEHTNAQERR